MIEPTNNFLVIRCLEDNGRKEDEDLGKKISLLIRRIES